MNGASSFGRTQFAEALAAMNVAADEKQIEAFEMYVALLLKWNRVYNLTAITKTTEVWTHHLLDSISIVPELCRILPGSGSVLDVGSGAGLPAVPIAVLRPDLAVRAVDAVGKKAAFINQAAVELRLPNLRGIHARVEKLAGEFDVITSRAFSSLEKFTSLTHRLLKDGGCWLAMKGKVSEEEVEQISGKAAVENILSINVPFLEEERHLLTLVKVR